MSTSRTTAEAERLWTISNLLSLLRLVLVIPAGITFWHAMPGTTMALFVAAAVTDVLDGHFARRFDQISELGKIVDPLADKVFVGVMVVLMLAKGVLPLWFVGAILFRDLSIFLGGLYIKRRTGEVLPSNYPGKIAVLVLSTTLLVIVAGVPKPISDGMIWLSTGLLALSFTLYLRRAAQVLRAPIEEALATARTKS